VLGVCARWIGIRTRCDGLDALPLTVTKHTLGVERERLASTFTAEHRSDAIEVHRQPLLCGSVHQIRHGFV
jgi:hypothetical protein